MSSPSISTRRAIAALTVVPLLGALAYANWPTRPEFSGVAVLGIAAYLSIELWLWGARDRAAQHRAVEAQKRAGYPLWSYTAELDRLWDELERRRAS